MGEEYVDYGKWERTEALSALEEPEVPAEDLDLFCAWKPLNDLGNAERLIARFGEDILYVEGLGWHCWDGARWNGVEGPRQVHLKAQATARALRQEAKALSHTKDTKFKHPERAATLMSYATRAGSSGTVAAMTREAEPHLTQRVENMDARPWRIVVDNGTLVVAPPEIETDGDPIGLAAHERADLMTLRAACAYDPEATAPTFRRFIDIILPDPEIQAFLQRWFGYCLTGDTREQCVVLFHGKGSNGKSTLITVISHILADYAVTLSFASVTADDRRRGSEATPDLARLPGRRAAWAAEPEVGARLSPALIKTMTGGEKMTVRQLNKPFFEFKPQFKLTLSFNNKPAVPGGDDGMWRRLKMVPFTAFVDESTVGPVFAALDAEAPGILNWMLDGLRDWREKGLAPPEAVLVATENYRFETDTIGQFLAQWAVTDATAKGQNLSAKLLRRAYELWCKEQLLEPMTTTRFGLKLSDKGLRKEKVGTMKYLNIMLREEAVEAIAADDQARAGAQ